MSAKDSPLNLGKGLFDDDAHSTGFAVRAPFLPGCVPVILHCGPPSLTNILPEVWYEGRTRQGVRKRCATANERNGYYERVVILLVDHADLGPGAEVQIVIGPLQAYELHIERQQTSQVERPAGEASDGSAACRVGVPSSLKRVRLDFLPTMMGSWGRGRGSSGCSDRRRGERRAGGTTRRRCSG